jgi:hypothetical protein
VGARHGQLKTATWRDVLEEIITAFRVGFFFLEEKDPYYNFLKLHLTKEHWRAGKSFLMGCVPILFNNRSTLVAVDWVCSSLLLFKKGKVAVELD